LPQRFSDSLDHLLSRVPSSGFLAVRRCHRDALGAVAARRVGSSPEIFTWRTASPAPASDRIARRRHERRKGRRGGIARASPCRSRSPTALVVYFLRVSRSPRQHRGVCFIGNTFPRWSTPLDLIFRPTSVPRRLPWAWLTSSDQQHRSLREANARKLRWCFTYGAHDGGMRVTREGSPLALALRLPSCMNYARVTCFISRGLAPSSANPSVTLKFSIWWTASDREPPDGIIPNAILCFRRSPVLEIARP